MKPQQENQSSLFWGDLYARFRLADKVIPLKCNGTSPANNGDAVDAELVAIAERIKDLLKTEFSTWNPTDDHTTVFADEKTGRLFSLSIWDVALTEGQDL